MLGYLLDNEPGTKITKGDSPRPEANGWHWSHPAAFYAIWCGLFLEFVAWFVIQKGVPKGDQSGYFTLLLLAAIPFNFLAGFLGKRYVKPRSRRRVKPRSRRGSPLACSNCGEPRLRFVASVIATWKCPHCGSRGLGKWGKSQKPAVV